MDTLRQHVASRSERRQNWVSNVTSEQHQLTSELTQFHDIIFVDVVDVYRNVPYKLLKFARWYCHLSVCLSVCLPVCLSICTGWAKLNDTNSVFDAILKNVLNNCDDLQFK